MADPFMVTVQFRIYTLLLLTGGTIMNTYYVYEVLENGVRCAGYMIRADSGLSARQTLARCIGASYLNCVAIRQ